MLIITITQKSARVFGVARNLEEAEGVKAALLQKHDAVVIADNADDLAQNLSEPQMREITAHVSALRGFGPDADKVEARVAELMSEGGQYSSEHRDRDKNRAAKKAWSFVGENATPDIFNQKPRKEKATVSKSKNPAVILKPSADDPSVLVLAGVAKSPEAVGATGDGTQVVTAETFTPEHATQFEVENFEALVAKAKEATKVRASKREPKEPKERKVVELGAGGHRAGTKKEQARRVYDEGLSTTPPKSRKDIIAEIVGLGVTPATAATWYGFFGKNFRVNKRVESTNEAGA